MEAVKGIGCYCVAWWRPALMTLWAAAAGREEKGSSGFCRVCG